MSCYAADLQIWRGNTVTLRWGMLNADGPLFPLEGSQFVLTVTVLITPTPVPIIVAASEDGGLAIDLTTSIVSWPASSADTAKLPIGKLASYRLDRLIDDTRSTLVSGMITGLGA